MILTAVIVMPVSAAYVAGFSGTPTTGSAPLTVQFTDLSSGAPTAWYWDFGDRATDTSQNPVHTYTAPGAYSVRLTVTGGGFSDSNVQIGYISVEVPTPVPTETTPTPVKAEFSGSPTTGTAPLTVKFTESSTGSPTSWKWNFGDGDSSILKNPSHIYTVPGSYTVLLTVNGSGGINVKSLNNYITVEVPVTAVLTQIPQSSVQSVKTTAIPASTSPVISRQPTVMETPATQYDQIGTSFLYAMVMVVIVVILEIAAIILYHRNKDKDQRK
jgi:PKD repeat protein